MEDSESKANKNTITVCDRCGKCCFMFIHQIHYSPKQIKLLEIEKIQNSLFQLFWTKKELFLREENGKMKYFVPAKEEFQKFIQPLEFDTKIFPPHQTNECIFLAWDNQGFPECRIQEYKPQMCKDYPDVKGGACLNHKERYYSRPFFDFQKRTVEMPIKVLKEFYRGKISDDRAYDILTLLMDYGRFNKELVQQFFKIEFKISEEEFKLICENLLDQNLISLYEDPQGILIEGISMKEIERVVDAVMKERGWIL